MSLSLDFTGDWGPATQGEVEGAIRECIGEPPRGEDWSVSLRRSPFYCEVRVKTPRQTRRRMFVHDLSELAKAVTDWLVSYPLM